MAFGQRRLAHGRADGKHVLCPGQFAYKTDAHTLPPHTAQPFLPTFPGQPVFSLSVCKPSGRAALCAWPRPSAEFMSGSCRSRGLGKLCGSRKVCDLRAVFRLLSRPYPACRGSAGGCRDRWVRCVAGSRAYSAVFAFAGRRRPGRGRSGELQIARCTSSSSAKRRKGPD